MSASSSDGRRRTALIAAGVLGAIAIGGGGFALGRAGQDDTVTVAPVATSTTAPAAPSAPSSTPAATATGQTVTGLRELVHAAYDLPPGEFTPAGVGSPKSVWRTTSPDQLYSLDDNAGVPMAAGRGVAEYRTGSCAKAPQENLAFIVWVNSDNDPPSEINPKVAQLWANAISLKKDSSHDPFTLGAAQPITVNHGKTPAIQSVTRITHSAPDAAVCEPPETELVVTSFSTGQDTATIVINRDVKVPGAMTDDELKTMVQSARPTP